MRTFGFATTKADNIIGKREMMLVNIFPKSGFLKHRIVFIMAYI